MEVGLPAARLLSGRLERGDLRDVLYPHRALGLILERPLVPARGTQVDEVLQQEAVSRARHFLLGLRELLDLWKKRVKYVFSNSFENLSTSFYICLRCICLFHFRSVFGFHFKDVPQKNAYIFIAGGSSIAK